MLVDRGSAFWTASGGFYDDISAGCDAWGLQAKAALVDALVLVPHTVVHQQALGDGDRTGWAAASSGDNPVSTWRTAGPCQASPSNTRRIFPFASITNVVRVIPMYLCPNRIFGTHTP